MEICVFQVFGQDNGDTHISKFLDDIIKRISTKLETHGDWRFWTR